MRIIRSIWNKWNVHLDWHCDLNSHTVLRRDCTCLFKKINKKFGEQVFGQIQMSN